MTKFRPTDDFCDACYEPNLVYFYRATDEDGLHEWLLCDECHPERQLRPAISLHRFIKEEVAA